METALDTEIPPSEVEIDEPLVRRLLSEQHPDLAGAPLERAGEGWDNITYRIGQGLAARLPRRRDAVDLLLHERRWLPPLAERLDVEVPAPIREGRPSDRYPWPWNVVPWIEGDSGDIAALDGGQGARLADLLRALHRDASPDAPVNPFRGVPLADRDALATARLGALVTRSRAERSALAAIWADGMAAARADRCVWIHGDLHPKNVVVRGGRLVGLIDWGDMCAGDPATDLAAAWTLLPHGADREAFWRTCGVEADLVRRARAWAVLFGVAMSGSGEPAHEAIGEVIIDNVLEGK